MQTKAVPETTQRYLTYEELYNNTRNAQNNEAILAWHMLGKKLHSDEDPRLSLRVRVVSVTENFCERFPYELAKNLLMMYLELSVSMISYGCLASTKYGLSKYYNQYYQKS